jgi:hypothetical protein
MLLSCISFLAWVPFPDPGAPNKIMRIRFLILPNPVPVNATGYY